MSVGGDIYVVACGPTEASTSLALDVVRRVPYDVNGYYLALGLTPAATRREIREAYQDLDGPNDARLTSIAKVLLNPARREQYDSVPPGALYYDDEVQTWQRRIRVHEVTTLLQQGYHEMADKLADTDVGVSLDDLLSGGQDEQALPFQPVWGWGYFLSNSRCMDVDRLGQWQAALVSDLGHRGVQVHVAVGFSGDMASPWGVFRNGHQIIVFLHEDERPTEALAQAAASRVVDTADPNTALTGTTHGDKKMTAPTGSFRKGAEEAKAASKAGANFARTEFFGLEDGKSCTVRFLTDADSLIVVDQLQVVPTKKSPFAGWPKDDKGHFVKWPEKMGSVCRKDVAFDYKGPDGKPECFVCDRIVDGKKVKKPSARNWALACLREEVRENGQVVGFRDMTREVKITRDGKEETITEKKIVVVNMGYKNFFSILQGFAGRYGTLLDRDYYIKREGSDTDTIYVIVPNDPIVIDGEVFDLREKKFMDRYKHDLNLEEIISERASDEFYAKFFDTRYTVVEEKDGDKHVGYKVVPVDGAEAQAAAEANPAPAAESGVDPERMKSLADRVKKYGGDSPAETPAEAPAAEQAPEPAAESEAPKEPAAAASGMRDFG